VNNLEILEKAIGYDFKDKKLLIQALTHPSVCEKVDTRDFLGDYQRLEFLGDAVLQLVLSHKLYLMFPEFPEGRLTVTRTELVKRKTLAKLGKDLNLGSFLVLGHGAEKSGGRIRDSIISDAFEAIIGAIFLDGGYRAVKKCILSLFDKLIHESANSSSEVNPKGALQEILQAESQVPPEYSIVNIHGPEHDRTFECVVKHMGIELGRGSGKRKKEAETQAALVALQNIRKSKKL
jgi:ribonuclease-3